MSNASAPLGAASASLSVGDVRAKLVYDEIAANPESVLFVEDVDKLPRFGKWVPTYLHAAVDTLVARGSITEAADGRLCLKPWAEA